MGGVWFVALVRYGFHYSPFYTQTDDKLNASTSVPKIVLVLLVLVVLVVLVVVVDEPTRFE